MRRVRWRLVGRHCRTGVQDEMLTGDQRRERLIGHRQMLHGAGLNEWRRKAAEQRELSAEHYRACWELLSIAGWDWLPGVDRKPVGRHRGNSVRDRN